MLYFRLPYVTGKQPPVQNVLISRTSKKCR